MLSSLPLPMGQCNIDRHYQNSTLYIQFGHLKVDIIKIYMVKKFELIQEIIFDVVKINVIAPCLEIEINTLI